MADPNFIDKAHIDLLLGASVHSRIIEGRGIRGRENEPIASISSLGWLISGEVPGSKVDSNLLSISLHCDEDPPLDEILQRFWCMEELSKNLCTAEEQECEAHFQSTHSRDPYGRYIVRLPFKVPAKRPQLGDSYISALHCLQRMKMRFEKDEQVKVAYNDFMSEYLSLNRMVLAAKAPVQKDADDCYFLPHHGVWKVSSSTTKLRTVFNGSSRTKSGYSLNYLHHSGSSFVSGAFIVTFFMRMWKKCIGRS